ncbi:MAG TPA: SDR family oxidoreductase [Polyangiales bacterium]|nr:SDR family oxidoreductase [Polyangiales bacterium]
MELKNSAILLTGASRGLGAALAQRLGDEGARVVLVARESAELNASVERLRARGVEAHALAADVGAADAAWPLAASAAALIGPLDVVIHNASTLGPTPLRDLLDLTPEDFERVLQVNLLAPFRLSRAIAGSMALRRRGVIVHVSSDASVAAYPGWGAYSVSKAALDHLARLWAVELAAHGVRAFSVDPGEMDTAMHRAALPQADPASLADPARVAACIVEMLRDVERIASGARLSAADYHARPSAPEPRAAP